MAGGRRGFSELAELVRKYPAAKQGCLVDTSILFSASYSLDLFNEDAERVFDQLADLKIPVYSNANVRAEFLELYRRVLIPECLIDFLNDMESELATEIRQKLVSLRTRYRTAHKAGKSFKLSEKEIKDLRHLFAAIKRGTKDGWELFCDNYLPGKIEEVWEAVVTQVGLNFIALRADEESSGLIEPFQWKNATRLMEKFGIGSVDAMILELFLGSKFPFLITADRDIAYCVEKLAVQDRFVFLPDRLISSR